MIALAVARVNRVVAGKAMPHVRSRATDGDVAAAIAAGQNVIPGTSIPPWGSKDAVGAPAVVDWFERPARVRRDTS